MRATDTDQVRWGFLGAGFVATQAVAPAVHASPHAQLHAVAARDADRARALAPRGFATDSYHAVLDDEAVEAVYISLTNEVHLLWIEAALAAGKHVLCEKPITLNAGECRTAFAAAQAGGLLLVEAAWTEWHPRTRRAEELVLAGDLGQVRTINSAFTFDGVPPDNYRLDPKRGGGSLLDVGPYILRPAVTCVDEVWIASVVHRQTSDLGTDLRTDATLTSQNGVRVEILSSFVDPEHQSLDIGGELASIRYGSPAFTSWREGASLQITEGDRGWRESFDPCDAYELMVDSVSRRIRGDQDAYVIAKEESVRCMELIDLIDNARPSAT